MFHFTEFSLWQILPWKLYLFINLFIHSFIYGFTYTFIYSAMCPKCWGYNGEQSKGPAKGKKTEKKQVNTWIYHAESDRCYGENKPSKGSKALWGQQVRGALSEQEALELRSKSRCHRGMIPGRIFPKKEQQQQRPVRDLHLAPFEGQAGGQWADLHMEFCQWKSANESTSWSGMPTFHPKLEYCFILDQKTAVVF